MITHLVETSGFGVQEWSPEEVRAKIYEAQQTIIERAMEHPEMKFEEDVSHVFADGIVGRRLNLPAGSWNTGKLHRKEDLLIIASGKVTFLTEHGIRTMEGPCMTTVKPMTKPLVYAHTDVVMFTAHNNPDNTRDIDTIVDRVVFSLEDELHLQKEDTSCL